MQQYLYGTAALNLSGTAVLEYETELSEATKFVVCMTVVLELSETTRFVVYDSSSRGGDTSIKQNLLSVTAMHLSLTTLPNDEAKLTRLVCNNSTTG